MKKSIVLLILLLITLQIQAQYSLSSKPSDQYIINKSFDTLDGKVYYTDATILIGGIITTFVLSETATSLQDKQNKALIGITSTVTSYFINKGLRNIVNKKKQYKKKRIRKYMCFKY